MSIVVKRKYVSRSVRAGLTFPVSKIHTHLRNGNYARRVAYDADVYLTAVLEFLTSELLKLAHDAAIAKGRTRINPRDIKLAIKDNEDFNRLLKDVIIPMFHITFPRE